MKNILICATLPQRFLDQIVFAKNIASETDNIKIKFFISDDVYSMHSEAADNLEFDIINNINKGTRRQNHQNVYTLIKYRIKKSLSSSQLEIIRKFINFFRTSFLFTNKYIKKERHLLDYYQKNYDKILNLIKNLNIDVLIINGDRHLGLEPVILKISKVLKIPTIIPYLVYFGDIEIIFDRNVATPKIIPNIFTSNYIIKSQEKLLYKIEKNCYYYPHYIGNALDKFGVLTKNPYVMGSGHSDILCIDCQYHKDLYVSRGLDEKKIRVLGGGFFDYIYKSFLKKNIIKENITKKYSLDYGKEIVIIALPQFAEHNELPWKEHWAEIHFLMENLNSLNVNILISLHPKMDRNNYTFLENEYKVKILDERLADVLPIADLFLATYSSTVIWSVLCGINTIIVDFYDFNYTMYDFLDTVIKVEKKENLKNILEISLIKDSDFSRDWKNLSKDSIFDGKTTQRYIDLIKNLNSIR